jgi:hypothetical protein
LWGWLKKSCRTAINLIGAICILLTMVGCGVRALDLTRGTSRVLAQGDWNAGGIAVDANYVYFTSSGDYFDPVGTGQVLRVGR